MINANWKRWIKISVNKHFDTKKEGNFLFFEGQSLKLLTGKDSWVELSIDGPRISEPSKNYFILDFDIQALCCVKQNTQLYSIDKLAGIFAAIFTNIIEIKKFGDQTDDNDSFLGCAGLEGEVRITDWGTDTADIPITRTAIEGSYRLELEGEL